MTLKRSKPACGDRTGSGITKLASFDTGYPTFLSLSQQKPDPIALIAARCGVAVSTVRAHCLAYGIGGAQ